MELFKAFWATFTLTVLGVSAATSDFPEEPFPFIIGDGKRVVYTHLGNDGMSFFDAMQYCYRNGLRPAVLRSAEEDNEIMDNLYKILNATINSRPFWLGLNDIENDGVFKWIGNSAEVEPTYTNWANGSPFPVDGNGPYLDCVSLQMGMDGAWVNLPCFTMWRPLCQPVFDLI